MGFLCIKCNTVFKTYKLLEAHQNRKVPCDFVCKKCYKQLGCRKSYYNHFASEHNNDINNNDSQEASIQNNIASVDNNNANNANKSNNTNSHNKTQINDIKNNVVMLHPLGLTHQYMDREKVVTPVKGMLLKMVREGKFNEAYKILFDQIHGNPELPEHHNIYVHEQGTEQACVFNGKYFIVESLVQITDDMYRVLKAFMKWSVNTSDIDDEEKDQLMWNIQRDWMRTDVKNDKTMERIFFNNKPVVHETFNKYKVFSNLEYIAKLNKCQVEQIKWDNTRPLQLPMFP